MSVSFEKRDEGLLKRCVERKRFLSGGETTFECQLVALEEGFGVLKYVIDKTWQVQNLKLTPGTVTYAFYWTQRPYNLYWWLDENGETLGHYFNLADSVELSAQEFVWRDLIVDVLALPDGSVRVLDAHEVPDTLCGRLRVYVDTGVQQIVQEHQAVVAEVAAALDRFLGES
jgi:predicted RNA-binding protein associated with RNAse of E/G family